MDGFLFARAVKLLRLACDDHALEVPSFRGAPLAGDVNRTLRRRHHAPPVVSIRLAGRPDADVVADMVEGVLESNGLAGQERARTRRRLLEAVQLDR